MSRETQDAQVAKQAREQIEYSEGRRAHRDGEPFQSSHSISWQQGWKASKLHGKA